MRALSPRPSAASVSERRARVWPGTDLAELDDAFDQARYAPNHLEVTSRAAANSDAARARLGQPKRFPYGPTPIEGLDIYVTKRPNAPVNVLIHGGDWRQGAAKDYAFAAELFVNAGAHFVIPDFTNVTATGGDLMPLADQVRRAIAWVHANAASFGGDPGRIFLTGHGSGAHLGATVLTTDWKKDFGLPAQTVKGALLCSGLYDLDAVRLSARPAYLKISDAVEQALSPQRHVDMINCPVALAHGAGEPPQWQRQARDFANALRNAGKPVQLLIGNGYNQFEMLETLANPYGLLGRAVLGQMKLSITWMLAQHAPRAW